MKYKDERLGGSSSTVEVIHLDRYTLFKYNHRGRVGIPEGEKDYIRRVILSSARAWIKESDEKKQHTLGIASYPIVDLFDPEISRRCNWIEVRRGTKTKAIVLDYLGEHNYRYFCYGSKDAIATFVSEFPNIKHAMAEHPFDFRLVLPSWIFQEKELPSLLGQEWELKYGNAEGAIRMVNDLSIYKPFQLELPQGLEIVDVTKAHVPSVMTLLEESYPHHSFRPEAPENHKVIIDSTSGKVLALSGILGQAIPPRLPPISLTGDLVVRKGYERRGLAKAVRKATLEQIINTPPFSNGIAVADANEMSYGVNLRLGYKPIPVDSTSAHFWWCIYNRI